MPEPSVRVSPAQQPAKKLGRDKPVVICLGAIFVINALDAYSIGPVPTSWIAQILTLALFALVFARRRLNYPPGVFAFQVFVSAMVLLTLFYVAKGDYRTLMPMAGTTGYFVYIGLRILTLINFIVAYVIVYDALCRGHAETIVKIIVWTGLFVAVAAVYIYVAQLYGLPEPPRTRIGTNNREQSTRFTYAFHRAMGTFREPGFLAQWLVLPLLLSAFRRRNPVNVFSVAMSTALMLTGALTGLVGIPLGMTAAFFIVRPNRVRHLLPIAGSLLTLGIGLLGFYFVAKSYKAGDVDFFQAISKRLAPIQERGMAGSNRAYVYRYVSEVSVPWIGPGLGHADMVFSRSLNADVIISFINLYFYILLSGGLFLFSLLLYVLIRPLWRILLVPARVRTAYLYGLAAIYCTWLVMFAIQSEELTLMFGFVCALLAYEVSGSRPGQNWTRIRLPQPDRTVPSGPRVRSIDRQRRELAQRAEIGENVGKHYDKDARTNLE
jgi:hypothetical protein